MRNNKRFDIICLNNLPTVPFFFKKFLFTIKQVIQVRKSIKIIIFSCLINQLFFLSAYVQDVIIKGNAPSYAGDELVFYSYSDMISFNEKKISKCIVDQNGDFTFKLITDKTKSIFISLGVYNGIMYIEPNSCYEIKLPKKVDKAIEEQLNPYFQEIETHFGVINFASQIKSQYNHNNLHQKPDSLIPDCTALLRASSQFISQAKTSRQESIRRIEKNSLDQDIISKGQELNYYIRFFDDYYNIIFNKYVSYGYSTRNNSGLDSAINKIDSLFSGINNNYFVAYKKYKFGFLRHLADQYRSKSISNDFFLNQEVLYSNTAYMDLFNQIYDKYFLFFSRTKNGKKIYKDIGKEKSLFDLKETLGTDEILANDTLKELVILKGLHDGFYSDDFSRSALLQVLDSLYSQSKIPKHKLIAINIRNKVTRLLNGYEPPQFELYNQDNELVKLSQFKGKYVYLNFCITQSYSCIREFEMLRSLTKKHGKILEIITIFSDKDLESSIDFLNKNDYDWMFLHYGNQPHVLKDYDIRGFPTYFLIGPEGKLVMSPAPSPGEHFESYFFNTLKARGDL